MLFAMFRKIKNLTIHTVANLFTICFVFSNHQFLLQNENLQNANKKALIGAHIGLQSILNFPSNRK